MKTKELLQEILESKEWGFEYHSKNHNKAKALFNASSDSEELKEINQKAEKDMEYHYKNMIKEQNYIIALKTTI